MTDRLTFYFYSSPYGIDWSSPFRLMTSTLINRVSWVPKPQHPIGHVNIELTSGSLNPRRRFLTGMVAVDASQQRVELLKNKIGLGVLFYSAPGRLESPKEIEAQFEPRYRQGSISALTLVVHPSTRARLEQYQREYEERRGYHQYGLPNRPLYLEGSGCSAFAASFLQVAGLAFPEFERNWTRLIRVPSDLIGDPASGKKVSLGRLFRERRARWAEASEPHREVFFWDPDLMHRWLVQTYRGLQSGRPLFVERPYRLSKRGRALELEIDLSHIEAPTQPIWPA